MKKSAFMIQDWLRTRPYPNPTKYDSYYFGVTKEIYAILEDEFGWFIDTFEEESEAIDMMQKLAITLASYFEDFAAEIGIWGAFTSSHHERFGRYLPFYDLTDYDPEYLNVQDIQYLIWHFISKMNPGYVYAPDHTIAEILANEIYEYLDEELDDALASDYFEKYLTIEDDIDLFVFRDKLKWFALHSSLLGMDLLPEFVVETAELIGMVDENGIKANDKILKLLMYDMEQQFYFNKRSSFMAITAPEWFSKVVRCSDTMRTQIANLHLYSDKFLVESITDNIYQFEHLQTRRRFELKKATMNSMIPVKIKEGAVAIAGLVAWNGYWHSVGLITIDSEMTPDKLEIERKKPVTDVFFYNEAQLQAVRSTTAEHERAFLDFFGSSWVISTNPEEIRQKYRDWALFFWERNNAQGLSHNIGKEEYKKQLDKMDFLNMSQKDVSEEDDFGLFFESGVGITATLSMQQIIDSLQASEPTDEDIKTVFFGVTRDTDPAMGKKLLELYGTKNFRFPFETTVSAADNITYLHCFEFPNDMGPTCPNVTIIG